MTHLNQSPAPAQNEQNRYRPNLGISFSNGKISSREIAKVAGKRHYDVLRDIRNQEEAWIKVSQRKFALADYTDICVQTLGTGTAMSGGLQSGSRL